LRSDKVRMDHVLMLQSLNCCQQACLIGLNRPITPAYSSVLETVSKINSHRVR